MKVLYISRSTLFSAPGGDTIQIQSTASALHGLGVTVDIKLTSDKIDYTAYDLIHYFNVIRPADILSHIKLSNKPFVITPIFVDYSEFDSLHRKGIVGLLYKLFDNPYSIEYIKVLARHFLNNEKINSLDYILKGQKKSIQYILKNAKVILPNSYNEFKRLHKEFSIDNNFVVVPNAIDHYKFTLKTCDQEAKRKNVITVARFEGLKNQLQIINALNHSNFRVKLIGKASPNQKNYLKLCKKNAGVNIEFVHHLQQEELYNYYRDAKVHLLPSWFETTGLSSLEAAAMGCNIVISDKGDQKEYFREFAFYCDPSSLESIAEQVEKAFNTPVDPAFRSYILSNFTWEKAAEKTLEAYNLALK